MATQSIHDRTPAPGAAAGPGYGAVVISLDFELHWGVRDRRRPDGAYGPNLVGARRAVPRMLESFDRHDIAATWATVGFLFARSKAEREKFRPAVLPVYADRRLDPYGEPTGEDERDDPLHYAPSLIRQILNTPRQEVATHTYSHYYCLEAGQTREAFAADLASAIGIAAHQGIEIRSIVFPRNQSNSGYAGVLREAGIGCYRGCEPAWSHRARARVGETLAVRAARWIGSYAGASETGLFGWTEVPEPGGLANVRSSMFLRPSSGVPGLAKMQFARIRRAIERAARRREIFHIWWHPHNFGVRTDSNIELLDAILRTIARFRDTHGLRSLSMIEAAETAMKLASRANAA